MIGVRKLSSQTQATQRILPLLCFIPVSLCFKLFRSPTSVDDQRRLRVQLMAAEQEISRLARQLAAALAQLKYHCGMERKQARDTNSADMMGSFDDEYVVLLV